ncbi:hypothetical protein THAOC_32058 [Thalassiosira oceanica]|uniref:MalT-like TPR region domain-containing protein n=1 Tax=Thalassiosira oceanica TaxID=159749 RepID=K0R6U2_THAOC|nr:hypothetical protein THAOC_32058 [Thalassiosira oceanica]|eukprot:EJK49098.1 hypothetical protein THAOC_32058 [Thalassiosira oceanica]
MATFIKLCDGACRLRVSLFGPEAPGVASCLCMQGVACLELRRYPLALASFKEALRIRATELSGTSGKEVEYNGASLPAHPLVVRLLNNIGCSLFELDELESAKETFVATLQMQRELKLTDPLRYNSSFEVDPKDAHQRLLGVALTLGNLGTIYLRLNELDLSLANYEEAVLTRFLCVPPVADSEDTGRPTPMPANPSATTMPTIVVNSPTGQEHSDIDPLNNAEGASRDEGENVTDPPVAAPIEESETIAADTSEGVVGEPSELDEVNSSVFAHSSIAVAAGFASMLLLAVNE